MYILKYPLFSKWTWSIIPFICFVDYILILICIKGVSKSQRTNLKLLKPVLKKIKGSQCSLNIDCLLYKNRGILQYAPKRFHVWLFMADI